MKISNIKDAKKKNATKAGKVRDISKFAKKTQVSSGKMNFQAIRDIAMKNGVDAENRDKTELIRAIQKAEGNSDCYSTAQIQACGQTNCLWREDCASC